MRIFLFKGLFGAIPSAGLDRLANELKGEGHTTSVHRWIDRLKVQSRLEEDLSNGKYSDGVVAIGHSLGGNSANYMADNLHRSGHNISYVATFDATAPRENPGEIVADNFRSRDIRAKKVPGAKDHYYPGLRHVEIDDDRDIHNIIVSRIAALDMNAIESDVLVSTDKYNELDILIKVLERDNSVRLSDENISRIVDLILLQDTNETNNVRPVRNDSIRNALGTGMGNLLDGRKTGYGIAGLLLTVILPIAFPQLAPFKALLGALPVVIENAGNAASNNVDAGNAAKEIATGPGKEILLPIFSALTGWGILGKVEKWVGRFKK